MQGESSHGIISLTPEKGEENRRKIRLEEPQIVSRALRKSWPG